MASEAVFRIGRFVLTETEVEKRKAYVELTAEDEALLREIHPRVVRYLDRIVEQFYEFLLSHAHTQALLSQPGLVERLKKIQTKYFLELTSGRYDLAYFENRLRVGLTHQRVGLEPEWYLGAYQRYLEIVGDVLRLGFEDDHERYFRTSIALSKIVFLDMSLAIDAYIFSAQESLASKAAEVQRANEELRKLDAAKRRLTDMIVHDLQNPLSGIVSFLQILHGGPSLSDEEKTGLEQALARCNDLSELILNVLQMSRAEEGKLDLYIENVDFAEVARRATEAFRVVAQHGQRKLLLRIDTEPVFARTDQSLLRRILYNLIRNALRHTPKGTVVEVRVSPGPPARISIEDDGPGIPPELQAHIFEPFAARAYGTESGLGLSFCKMAADALGLDLRLENGRAEGACFVLTARGEPEPEKA